MNPATQAMEGNVSAPMLYMALKLNSRSCGPAFGDGAERYQASVPAAELAALADAVAKKAKECFKTPASVRVPHCCAAARVVTASSCTGI